MGRATPLIAVVDDNDDVRIAFGRLARSAGLAMEGFASGMDFLRSIEDHEPDCVLLDLRMPGMDGFEVQAALARRHATLPVIVITAHDTAASRARAVALGACACLRKPVDDDVLLAAVAHALGTAAN